MGGREVHLFDHNVEAHHRYNELIREGRIWNSMNQFILAHECSVLAQRLLNGDDSVINTVVRTEGNFVMTKRFLN